MLVSRLSAPDALPTAAGTYEIARQSFTRLLFGKPSDSETPRLTRRPLSPERGQLLITLLNFDINFKDIIFQGADFSRSDLRGSTIVERDLKNINFTASNFSFSDLQRNDFGSAFLSGVDFTGSCLDGSGLSGAILLSAKFSRATFRRSVLESPEALAGTDLTDADLSGLLVSGSDWLDRLASLSSPPRNFFKEHWLLEKGEKTSFMDDSFDPYRIVSSPAKPKIESSGRTVCG